MDIRKTIEISCTPAALWPWLTVPAMLKEWVPGFEGEVPDDASRTSGVGASSTMRLREGSRISTYRSVVTRWDVEKAVEIRLTGGAFAKGMHMDVGYDVSPCAQGCRLDYRARCDMKGVYVFLAPVFWLAGRANATRALQRLSIAASRAAG